MGRPRSLSYLENGESLRKRLLESFRRITGSHPIVKRIVEVRYAEDVDYEYGMHFRLLGKGIKVSTVSFA